MVDASAGGRTLTSPVGPRRGAVALGAGAPDHAVVFTGVAVATAFVLLLMPSQRHDYREVAVAAVLGAGLLAIACLWRRQPGLVRIGVPLGYLLFAALLRDAAGGSDSGFGGLLLLPVLWLALTAGRRALAAALVGMGLAQLVPLIAIGPPWYPTSGWRAAVVLTSVALITGLMVRRLVGNAQARSALLEHQAADLERASGQLLEQNERLVELDRLKDEFVAVVSHELRTPLTSIGGYLEMALESDDPAARHQHLATVQRNVVRLRSLVTDLLFLARSDARGLELQLGPVDLGRLLEEAAESARPAVAAQGIELDLSLDPVPSVVADRDRIAQLVDNLVANAVKFTPAGGRVELGARREGPRAVVSVADTGIGIPSEELPYLFERFYRGSTATHQAIAGTGLGLSIARLIADAHGATLEVESALGRGSRLRLALLLPEAERSGTVELDAPQLPARGTDPHPRTGRAPEPAPSIG